MAPDHATPNFAEPGSLTALGEAACTVPDQIILEPVKQSYQQESQHDVGAGKCGQQPS